LPADSEGFGRSADGYVARVIEVCHEAVGMRAVPVAFVSVRRASARELARLLRTAVAAGDLSIVVDLGDGMSASSDLLGVLHKAARGLRQHGGRLGVVSTQSDVRRLLDLTLLSRGFPVFASRDEALRSWR